MVLYTPPTKKKKERWSRELFLLERLVMTFVAFLLHSVQQMTKVIYPTAFFSFDMFLSSSMESIEIFLMKTESIAITAFKLQTEAKVTPS